MLQTPRPWVPRPWVDALAWAVRIIAGQPTPGEARDKHNVEQFLATARALLRALEVR